MNDVYRGLFGACMFASIALSVMQKQDAALAIAAMLRAEVHHA